MKLKIEFVVLLNMNKEQLIVLPNTLKGVISNLEASIATIPDEETSDSTKVVILDKKYVNSIGLLHREDGPAIEYNNGDKSYYINGKLHREDGPAIIRDNHAEIWHHGEKISETDEYYVSTKSARK